MGPFSVDAAMMKQMVDACISSKVAIPVDYEHASVFSDRAPASGWIEPGNLEVRKTEDGQHKLWGKIDWTPNAADQVRAREYRYLSPTIVFNTRDRKTAEMTGASLHSVALTNKPFLEELPEVRLNSVPGKFVFAEERKSTAMNEEARKAMIAAFGLPEDVSDEQIALAAQKSAAAVADRSAALSALGLQPDAKPQDIKAAILRLQNPAERVDPGEFESIKRQLAERDARDKVAAAVADFKVTAPGTPLHSWALTAALETPEMFDKWVKAAPKRASNELKVPSRAPTPSEIKKPEDVTEDDLTPEEARALRVTGMSPADFIKYNRVADQNLARRMQVSVSELTQLRAERKADGL